MTVTATTSGAADGAMEGCCENGGKVGLLTGLLLLDGESVGRAVDTMNGGIDIIR